MTTTTTTITVTSIISERVCYKPTKSLIFTNHGLETWTIKILPLLLQYRYQISSGLLDYASNKYTLLGLLTLINHQLFSFSSGLKGWRHYNPNQHSDIISSIVVLRLCHQHPSWINYFNVHSIIMVTEVSILIVVCYDVRAASMLDSNWLNCLVTTDKGI